MNPAKIILFADSPVLQAGKMIKFTSCNFTGMDDFRLRVFLAVARTGSFTTAAGQMGISQPAVSQNIGGLENELGSKLFVRSRHSAVLTEEGRVFLPYAEQIVEVGEQSLVIKRRLSSGVEVVECPVPAVITVNESAAECRPRNAKRVMKFKGALATSEIAAAPESVAAQRALGRDYLRITEWGAADVEPDMQQLGLQGSPTKVKKIENVVFAAKEAKRLTAADEDINSLMVELIASHTLG